MKNEKLVKIEQIPSILQQNYQFIDLRNPKDYNILHITKFINIPYHSILNKLSNLKLDIPIILICYTGVKSNEISSYLNSIGYRAYSIEGGFYSIENNMKR